MEKTIYLAGGCYWGVEKYAANIRGVLATEVGFANGGVEAPQLRHGQAGGYRPRRNGEGDL